jgi:hypothetical protein
MTIALGILSGDTQIIAADTQMSTDQEKFSQGKISWAWSAPQGDVPAGAIAITGSGDEFLLRALQKELGQLFVETRTEPMQKFRAALGTALKSFYREYIAITPDVNQRPEVELIIAARRGESKGTWITKHNKTAEVESCGAVGIGAAYAQGLLSELTLPMEAETAALLAAYVVFLVKKRNLWVGMDTTVVILDGRLPPLPFGLDERRCRRLEEIFRQCSSVESRALHRMLGSSHDFCDAGRLAKDLEIMRELVHPNRDISSPRSQT